MTQFIAMGAPRPGAKPDGFATLMTQEVETVWRDYRRDFIRQIFERGDGPGVVMFVEANSKAEVEAMLAALPMSKAGLLDTEVIELKPFLLWRHLFAKPVE